MGFAQLMELEVWPSTASSVLMVHSSTRTTSSVTGGSTLTVPLLKIFIHSMMKLLLSVMLFQELLLMLLVAMMPLLQTMRLVLMLVLDLMRKLKELLGGLEITETTDVVEEAREGVEISEVELDVSWQQI